jgi:flavin-dependent dehydrogenase
MSGPANKNALTIAGCGAAGCFLALRALQLGLKPTLLRAPIPAVGGVEIIPASAERLLEALGLGPLLANLSPGLSDGLIRYKADGSTDISLGRSLHVDRLKFREGLVAEAARLGARIRDVDRLPPVDPSAYSVDATGQRAIWSRPLVRRGRQIADIFVAETCIAPGTARLALLGQGWAYLASDQNLATIGVVGRPMRRQSALNSETCRALGLTNDISFRFLGRRPAFLQWATDPFVGRRLAVGDAAFHHNPIGGRGLSFALGSAFAAAAALASCRDDLETGDVARAYYKGYVAAEIRQHLSFLDAGVDASPATVDFPERVRWRAPVVTGALAIDAHVVSGDMFSLAAGQKVRWAGGLDLVFLRELTIEAQLADQVADSLRTIGLSPAEAKDVLVWAITQGLIEAANV